MAIMDVIQKLHIKSKLILIIMTSTITGLLLAGTVFIILDRYWSRQRMVQNVTVLGKVVADRSTAAISFNDPVLASENLVSLRTNPWIVAAWINDSTGQTIAKYVRESGKEFKSPENPDALPYLFEKNYLFNFEPIVLDKSRIGMLYICSSLSEIRLRQLHTIILVSFIMAVISLVCFFLSARLQKFISEPLIQQEEKYRIISNTVSDYVFSTTVDEEGRILNEWVDGAFELITGYTFEQYKAIGRLDSLVHPDDLFKYKQFYGLLLEGQHQEVEVRIITAKGKTSWIRIYALPVPDNKTGKISRFFGGIQDITLSKEAQEEIAQLNQTLEKRVETRTSELEKANKDLEAFAYSISHDLRAPLRHIDGFTSLLRNHLTEKTPEIERYFDKITASSSRMADMIDSLLKYSQLGQAELKRMDIGLNDLINEVLDTFIPALGNRLINFHIGDLPIVNGDHDLLKIVFENLISNAIKFTSKTEKAMIEIGQIQDGQNGCQVYIRDNGTGFDMKYSDKLFQVFQRLHNANEFEGTGIGLANVKQIIQRHGWKIRAEAKTGQGATFFITF